MTMKVEKIDYIWAAVSMVIVGVSFRRGELINGLLMIYVLMALLFAYHIYVVRRRLKSSIAAVCTVTDYYVSPTGKKLFAPIVKYETETGRAVTSVYTVSSRKKSYEIGEEATICYSPEDPMFFYFLGKEHELTADYSMFIFIGANIAVTLFIIDHS